MSIITDLVLVVIVSYCAWRGFKDGIMLSLFGVLAMLISLYGANLVATVYYSEFTGMLQPFVGGIMDNSISETVGDEEEADLIIELTDEEKTDVYAVSYASVKNLGVSDSASKLIAEDVALKIDRVGQLMSDSITERLSNRFAFTAIFGIVFILLIIVFTVIGNVVNLSFALPGYEKIDSFTGLALGLLKGVVILFFIACLFRYVGIILLKNTVENTALFKWLINKQSDCKYCGYMKIEL